MYRKIFLKAIWIQQTWIMTAMLINYIRIASILMLSHEKTKTNNKYLMMKIKYICEKYRLKENVS